MNYTVGTVYRPTTLKINIEANALSSCTVYIEAFDPNQANTYYTRRYRLYQPGEKESLYIQMPVTGKSVHLQVFENPYDKNAVPSSFAVKSIKVLPLAKQLNVIPYIRHINEFIQFMERFCFNAGVLTPYKDRYYVSSKKNFEIYYLPQLFEENGSLSITPARIGIFDTVIDVSQEKFIPMTIAERAFIICHEFSHRFWNKDMYNETEADLNGLHLYLALGFSRIEAIQVASKMFTDADSQETRDRYQRMLKFIDDFEKITQKYT